MDNKQHKDIVDELNKLAMTEGNGLTTLSRALYYLDLYEQKINNLELELEDLRSIALNG